MVKNRSIGNIGEQILEDKNDFWEYRLTSVLIKNWVSPVNEQWEDLRSGLYAPVKRKISDERVLEWFSDRMNAVSDQTSALAKLVNDALPAAWGPPGQPGSEHRIVKSCSYIADACENILEWEESLYKSRANDPFSGLIEVAQGAAGHNIVRILQISTFIDDMLASGPKGDYHFDIVISLPEGWEGRMNVATERVRLYLGG